MRLFTTTAGIRSYLKQHRQGLEVGLVPTMGALHAGHLSLIEQAKNQNKLVIVSIFVNPLQFGPTEDFQQYPRQIEQDRQLCEKVGVDAIFAPTAAEMGIISTTDSELTQVVPPPSMTSVLCGRSRIGHFQGVATIVTKLLNLIQPERAYFGEKDAQQLAIIQRLVEELKLPVQIVPCPIVRESSGLAYSSRNQYLTPEQREQAQVLYRGLGKAKDLFSLGERSRTLLINAVKQEIDTIPAFQMEYLELVDPTTLIPLEQVAETGLLAIAAKIDSTRLIDNIILRNRQPIVAIDGPAGAGKSTVTREVAKQLGLLYLDTGAMYRAVTWLVLQSGIALDDESAIAELVSQFQIKFVENQQNESNLQIFINDHDVTQAIRSMEVTAKVSAIAALHSVRTELVRQQQNIGKKGGIVAEGRDIGTNVFPDAELKIFLTASVKERARRRLKDLQKQGQKNVSLEQLENLIQERDMSDSNRTFAPLRQAIDAVEIQTDNLTIAEVINQIIGLYKQQLTTNN
ncbi:MAG TPA: bifunctional pantoate--beta-alanine ligase/(d)CMP kinase [Oculatellaceae cyanobacterium]|jgi:pantoate ligase/cytidylate kinase